MANAGISEGMGNTLATIEPDSPVKPDLKVVEVDLHGVIYCKSSDKMPWSPLPFLEVRQAWSN